MTKKYTAVGTFLGLAVALFLALRPGLRLEEVSSLCLATGHSLEQRPDFSDPAWNDFELPARAQPASVFQTYTQNKPGPGLFPKEVVRAVLLSTTHPPAYYLLLHTWLKLWGSGDFALRIFSILCWLACVPLLWRLSSRLGGRFTAPLTCLLFTLNPLTLYYASVGSMVTLLWLEALLLAELSYSLAPGLLWVIVAIFGFYTHEAFIFVWLACTLILATRLKWRRPTLRLSLASLALFIPWMAVLPGSLSAWRASHPPWMVKPSFSANPLAQAAQTVIKNFKDGDSVLVAGAPAGILGVARALPANMPVAGWVSQYTSLDLRWDLEPRLEGSRRVFLVMASPEDGRRDVQIRLRTTSFLADKFQFGNVDVDCFTPMAGIKFQPGSLN